MNKVLIFADPTSIHTKKWIEGWHNIGYQTVLSGLSDKVKNEKTIFNENISSQGGNGSKYLKYIFKFAKIMKKETPSIINTHYMSSYGLIGALIKEKRYKVVLSLHGSDIMIDMNKNFIYSLVSKFVLNRADLLVSVSETMTKKILVNFPHLKTKILTQQYGVNIAYLDSFYSFNKEIDIITNRQWKPNSNYEIILKALKLFHNFNIKLIGNDNSSYAKKLLSSYEYLAQSSTGMISYEQNLKYVAKSKIFISLTSSDGIPLSLIEAMYLGAIPIVSDIEPNRELIKNALNGFVTLIDETSLQNKIEEVLNLDIGEIKKIQEYNKKLVLEKFDFEKNFKKLETRLKESTFWNL